MVMPLVDLRAIYELLFRDGVMVTKKDKRPQCMHPEIPGVANLKVIRAMGSLKSRGYVRETFAWKHAYYYLTNEGIVYLRDYLRLPPEIVPSSLQRVRRPASTLDVMRRAARVQTVEGPTSYVPKPRGESQEGMMDRQGYRHKRQPGDEEASPDKPPMRFRGSYQPRGPGAQEPGVQTQTFFRRGQGMRRGEERAPAEDQGPRRGGFRTSYLPPESRAVRSPAPGPREVKPPTPEIPISAPIEPEPEPEVFIAPVAAPVAVEVVEQAVEEPEPEPEPEPVVEAPASVVEDVAAEIEEAVEEEAEVVEVVETIEEVAAEPVVEAEPADSGEEEESEEDEEDEAISEEAVEEPVVLEEEEPKAVVDEAPEPIEVIGEEEIIEAAQVEQTEEEPLPVAAPEEAVEKEDDMVVVEEPHADDVPQEADIEILDEPAGEELEEEPVTIEEPVILEEPVAVEEPIAIEEPTAIEEPAIEEPETITIAESAPAAISEDIEVEAPIQVMTKADGPELSFHESEIDLPTPPPPVAEDFTDLSENHVETVVQHITHTLPTTLELTPETSYQVTQEVVTTMEEAVETQFITQTSHTIVTTPMTTHMVSESGLEEEQSGGLESAYAVPIVPSECPIAALKSSLPQGDWGFLTEDPEEEAQVKKVWPDSLEG